jgi:hypothetical protein
MRLIKSCFNKQLAHLCKRSFQLEELTEKVERLLPEALAQNCRVGGFEKGCLTLVTPHSGWASQLRYAVPELRDALRKDAGMYQLTSIQIAIAEPITPPQTPKEQVKKILSEEAKATIISESQACSYQPLKKALLHLAHGDPDTASGFNP